VAFVAVSRSKRDSVRLSDIAQILASFEGVENFSIISCQKLGRFIYPRLAEVHRGHVFFIHSDLIMRQAPRILQDARQMCEQIEQVRRVLIESAKIKFL